MKPEAAARSLQLPVSRSSRQVAQISEPSGKGPPHSSKGSGGWGHPEQFSQKCQDTSSGRLRKPMDIAGRTTGLLIMAALLSLTRVMTTGTVKGSTPPLFQSALRQSRPIPNLSTPSHKYDDVCGERHPAATRRAGQQPSFPRFERVIYIRQALRPLGQGR